MTYKVENLFLPVTGLSICGIIFSVWAEFYFYEAVVAFLAVFPLFLGFFSRAPRATLLGALMVSICFNPGVALWENNTFDFSIALFLYLSDTILIVILLHLMLNKITGRRKSAKGKISNSLLYLYLVWLAVSGVSSLFAVDKSLCAVELVNMVRNLFIFLCIYNLIETGKDLEFAASFLVIACSAQALLILAQYGFDGQLIRFPGGSRELDIVGGGTVFRPGGTLGHSSHFAKIAALAIPVSFSMFQNSPGLSRRTAFGISTAVLLLALMVSISRIGLLTSLLGLAWIISRSLKTPQGRRVFLVSLLVCLTALGTAWIVAGDRLVDRITNDESSAEARVPMWLTAAQVIVHNPQGVGLNNYLNEARKYDDFGIVKSFPFPVHNIYLLYLAETGVVGGVIFIWFLIATARHSFNASRRAALQLDSAILHGLGVGITCSWLQGMVGWGHRSSMVHLAYLAAIAGLVTAYRKIGPVAPRPAHAVITEG